MNLAIRWTVGDVSSQGFEALALSIAGVRTVFGASTRCVVCVNTVALATAQARVGKIAGCVEWYDSTGEIPPWLRPYLDRNMAEGVAWKFAAARLPAEGHVLSLDNDVILWRIPTAVRDWLEDGDSLLIAEDVRACNGQFARFCPEEPRNSGMVGVPPRFDFESRLRRLLAAAGVCLSSETDEQGLQVAVVSSEKHHVVSVRDVSISGYFRPHLLELGACGAHFVGVNGKDCAHAHGFWDGKRGELAERLPQDLREDASKMTTGSTTGAGGTAS